MATQDDIYLAKPTREEIDDVLTQRLTATVATLNPDDSIHLAYVIFLYESGKLYWETASSTRKIKEPCCRVYDFVPPARASILGNESQGLRRRNSQSHNRSRRQHNQ